MQEFSKDFKAAVGQLPLLTSPFGQRSVTLLCPHNSVMCSRKKVIHAESRQSRHCLAEPLALDAILEERRKQQACVAGARHLVRGVCVTV